MKDGKRDTQGITKEQRLEVCELVDHNVEDPRCSDYLRMKNRWEGAGLGLGSNEKPSYSPVGMQSFQTLAIPG